MTGERVRQKQQAARATTFEVLDVDTFRDIVSEATGRPVDEARWGKRITGADALHLNIPLKFNELGGLCRDLLTVHDRDDYKARLPWLDRIQPVSEPETIRALEDEVVRLTQAGGEDFDLAPPEVVEWERVAGFRFDFESRKTTTRPEMRLTDYRAGIDAAKLDALTAADLKAAWVRALDGAGDQSYQWSIWRCLFGELAFAGNQYVLDDGEFLSVAGSYLGEIESFIDTIEATNVALPPASPTMHEGPYNAAAVGALGGRALLLDLRTVRSPSVTTAVEICDIFTDQRQLVHVKRHLGSRDLSHLFAQGFVSANLLQNDREFRQLAIEKIAEVSGGDQTFELIDIDAIKTQEFEVVYAIVAGFSGRKMSKALPFFSKVNLMRTAETLRARGYKVSCQAVQVDPDLIGLPAD